MKCEENNKPLTETSYSLKTDFTQPEKTGLVLIKHYTLILTPLPTITRQKHHFNYCFISLAFA